MSFCRCCAAKLLARAQLSSRESGNRFQAPRRLRIEGGRSRRLQRGGGRSPVYIVQYVHTLYVHCKNGFFPFPILSCLVSIDKWENNDQVKNLIKRRQKLYAPCRPHGPMHCRYPPCSPPGGAPYEYGEGGRRQENCLYGNIFRVIYLLVIVGKSRHGCYN